MAHQITSEINKSREIDPMLDAIAQMIIDTQVSAETGADLSDFVERNVFVIAPEADSKDIDRGIDAAINKAKGLCLMLIAGSAKNPDPDAPGPRAVMDLELQLYVHPKLRPKGSRTALELVGALMRGLHDAQIRVTGFPWFEEIRWTGFDPVPDNDLTAYSITFEREMQL